MFGFSRETVWLLFAFGHYANFRVQFVQSPAPGVSNLSPLMHFDPFTSFPHRSYCAFGIEHYTVPTDLYYTLDDSDHNLDAVSATRWHSSHQPHAVSTPKY